MIKGHRFRKCREALGSKKLGMSKVFDGRQRTYAVHATIRIDLRIALGLDVSKVRSQSAVHIWSKFVEDQFLPPVLELVLVQVPVLVPAPGTSTRTSTSAGAGTGTGTGASISTSKLLVLVLVLVVDKLETLGES